MVFSSGNAGGIVASLVYRGADAPRFFPGHGTAVGFCFANFSMAALLWWRLGKENKRRQDTYGSPPHEDEVHDTESPEYLRRWGLEGKSQKEILELGDDHPAFRYVL